jgi:hypothetical protein
LVFSYKSVPEIEEKLSVAVSVTRCEICAEPLPSKQELVSEEANITVQAFL